MLFAASSIHALILASPLGAVELPAVVRMSCSFSPVLAFNTNKWPLPSPEVLLYPDANTTTQVPSAFLVMTGLP
ncbi:hypothetical protein D9M72_577220 [compost metagenome]